MAKLLKKIKIPAGKVAKLLKKLGLMSIGAAALTEAQSYGAAKKLAKAGVLTAAQSKKLAKAMLHAGHKYKAVMLRHVKRFGKMAAPVGRAANRLRAKGRGKITAVKHRVRKIWSGY